MWSDLPEVILKKNDPAPYQGMLIPEANYRIYKIDEEFTNEISNDLKLPTCINDEPEQHGFLYTALWFTIGFAVSGVIFSSHH